MTKISEFTVGTDFGAADLVPYVQSGVNKSATWDITHKTSHGYRLIPTSRYTALPSTTSVILMSTTSDFFTGLPVRYKFSGNTLYGIVTAVTANTSITVAGPALAPATALTELAVGTPGMVSIINFFVTSTYGNGSGDLLAPDMNTYYKWLGRKSYLATFSCVHKTADTGAAQPKINVKINGSAVSTADSSNGVQLSTAGTWVDNTVATVSTSLYDINFGEAIEVNCTVGGTNGNANNLTVLCVFVQE